MLSILGYDGTTITSLEPTAIAGWLNQAGAKIWLDAQEATDEERAWVYQVFSLPQEKGEGWPVAAAFLHPTPRLISGHLPFYPVHSLDFHLGNAFLLTIHPQELPALTSLWHIYRQDLSRWPYGLDYLLYQLLQQLTIFPTTTQKMVQEKLQSFPDDQSAVPLLSLAHQLHGQKFYRQQALNLVEQLAHLDHAFMDANTGHHCQQLRQQLNAQVEEINLWQNWLTIHQQQYQLQQNHQTQERLRRLFWLILIGFLACLLIIILLALSTW